jgi:class 3 adenylate cyclase
MDRVWQWAWDRFGPRYSWAAFALAYVITVPMWLATAVVVAEFESSDRYVQASATAAAILVVVMYLIMLPGHAQWHLIEQTAAGALVDPFEALKSTYQLVRSTTVRAASAAAIGGGVACALVGLIAGAGPSRLIQYGIIGASTLTSVLVIALHQFPESFIRPARIAIAANSSDGDSLPRTRPTFAAWSNMSVLATAWAFTLGGAGVATIVNRVTDEPVFIVVIATGMTLVFAVPITVGAAFAPSLRPIRDLAEGTERVAGGDYTRRLPVVQDDDLGALTASFNRMQAGLAERERLQAAFGSYVDPALATRLLAQGDDVFTGERLDVTVMFVDVRDFTPFAESHEAEDAVSHLNALFEIVVPAVLDAGGHVNKYLGDGALAVFGAPNPLDRHADAAITTARRIQRLVAERFDGELRVGIGINTGTVIAGTIGGAGKLEFTLIGDAVNVAARVEQLTKTTGDSVLLTQHTFDVLPEPPGGLIDRGLHDLKGKSSAIRVFAI